VIGLGGGLTDISVVIGVAAAVAAAGLGVGLGTAFPRFDAANPAEVPIGTGGFLYMGLSLLHSAGLVALAARPVYLSFSQPGLNYLGSPVGGLWLLLLLAFTVLPAGLALLYGYSRMGRSA
jgi:ABC-2 type transport system permease protein